MFTKRWRIGAYGFKTAEGLQKNTVFHVLGVKGNNLSVEYWNEQSECWESNGAKETVVSALDCQMISKKQLPEGVKPAKVTLPLLSTLSKVFITAGIFFFVLALWNSLESRAQTNNTDVQEFVPSGNWIVDIYPATEKSWHPFGEEFVAGDKEWAYQESKVVIHGREYRVVYPLNEPNWIGSIDLGPKSTEETPCDAVPVGSIIRPATMLSSMTATGDKPYLLTGQVYEALEGEFCFSGYTVPVVKNAGEEKITVHVPRYPMVYPKYGLRSAVYGYVDLTK